MALQVWLPMEGCLPFLSQPCMGSWRLSALHQSRIEGALQGARVQPNRLLLLQHVH